MNQDIEERVSWDWKYAFPSIAYSYVPFNMVYQLDAMYAFRWIGIWILATTALWFIFTGIVWIIFWFQYRKNTDWNASEVFKDTLRTFRQPIWLVSSLVCVLLIGTHPSEKQGMHFLLWLGVLATFILIVFKKIKAFFKIIASIVVLVLYFILNPYQQT